MVAADKPGDFFLLFYIQYLSIVYPVILHIKKNAANKTLCSKHRKADNHHHYPVTRVPIFPHLFWPFLAFLEQLTSHKTKVEKKM
jgi:hypothetical protein